MAQSGGELLRKVKDRMPKTSFNRTAEQNRIFDFDKDMTEAGAVVDSVQNQAALPADAQVARNAALAATQAGVQYGVDQSLGADIATQAGSDPNASRFNLNNASNSQQGLDVQAALRAAGSQSGAGNAAAGQAVQATGALAGPGSYAPQQAGALGQFGDQVGQFSQDVGLLRRTAEGTGPSAAQAMMQSALGQNARAMQAVAGQARGGNLAAGIRAATQAGAQQGLQSTNQLAALRAQEQLTGQAQLAGAQGQLSGAMANRSQAITGATNAETARNQAFAGAASNAANAMTGATNAGTGVAQAGSQQHANILDAIKAAETLRMQGVNTQANILGTQVQNAGQNANTGLANVSNALAASGQLGGQFEDAERRKAGAYEAGKAREFGAKDAAQLAFNVAATGGSMATMAAGKP